MTFAELGIPFPLWDAPVKSASEYVGLETCSLCQNEGRHCFRLGIGDDVVVSSSHCKAENGLDADGKESGVCVSCGEMVPFPVELAGVEELQTCYECLRAGKAALTKNTVFGMIRWEDAQKGQTHGVPGLNQADVGRVELVEVEDGWKAVRLAPEMMWELLRTPAYTTWQGEQWQFDEGQPMIYVGEWNQADFNQNAPDGDGEKLFDEIVSDQIDDHWKYIRDEQPCVYVFRSATREKWAAHWDAD